ncbi:MAG TPA: hypothetical protein VJ860_09410 [Polyangia bacterium]|nr:hypothetical protein [Polyangia bacterium]
MRHATITTLTLFAIHVGCGNGGTSGSGLPAASGTGGSTSGSGGTAGSGTVDSGGVPGNGGVGGGGTVGAAGVTDSGGAAGSPVGPSFEQYSLLGVDTSDGATYSSNGVLTSSTYYFFVKNTGVSGVATVTVSYQGYVETNKFTVEGGAQYVLASQFTGGNGQIASCELSADLPGLTLTRNFAGTNALASNFGKCTKVAGQSMSELIPLSSCTCSGGCSGRTSCMNNCGFADEQCCGGCSAGKTCQSGFCL